MPPAAVRSESMGLVARRRLRAWILRRGAQGAWRRSRLPRWLAWGGLRWPRAAESLRWAGLLHLAAGRPAEAVSLFESAVARGLEGWASLRFDLGMALLQIGELSRAEAEMLAACRLSDDAPWAAYGLRRCLIMRGLADDVARCIAETDAVEAAEPGGGPNFGEQLWHVIPMLPPRHAQSLRAVVARHPGAMHARLFLAHLEAQQERVATSRLLLAEVARNRWPQWATQAGFGTLPSFLIIGQAKAGTSSLFRYLTSHPRVVAPLIKELHFWSLHHRHGLDWYRAFFPPLPPQAGLITGEASPSYLVDAEAPQRIARQLPDVRVIVLLRDPVGRAYSHFRMNERVGLERETFDEVVAREFDSLASCPLEPGVIPAGYLTESAALPYLKRWLTHIPRERLLIVQNRDLAADLAGVMARVCRHVGVEPFVPSDPQRHNEGHYPPMPEALERRLQAWFAPHDRALAEFLDGLKRGAC